MIHKKSDLASRFHACVDLFGEAKDKEGRSLAMTAFAVESGGERHATYFGGAERPTDLRSVSKVVTALTAGMLFERYDALGGAPFGPTSSAGVLLRRAGLQCDWTDVEVLHMLNNTIGHQVGFLFRKDLAGVLPEQYVDYALSAPRTHRGGQHFSYSNVGPFLFSVLIQELTGKSLGTWAEELVLGPLGIEGHWKDYGGYTAGCTGLEMGASGLLKIGVLLKVGGETAEGVRLVASDWVSLMRSPLARTPEMFDPARVFPKFAYGVGLWICQDGRYYCDGTDGQYLIVVPDRDLVIVTTGRQSDMKPITRCMLPLIAP